MDYITTTELRTKSKQLLKALAAGKIVSLIHRSKVIGRVQPNSTSKPFNPERFKKIAEELNLPKLSLKQREKNYREHVEKKYGKSVSRYQRVHRPVVAA